MEDLAWYGLWDFFPKMIALMNLLSKIIHWIKHLKLYYLMCFIEWWLFSDCYVLLYKCSLLDTWPKQKYFLFRLCLSVWEIHTKFFWFGATCQACYMHYILLPFCFIDAWTEELCTKNSGKINIKLLRFWLSSFLMALMPTCTISKHQIIINIPSLFYDW